MITFRPWGSFKVIHVDKTYLVKIITVNPHHRTSLQYHNHREEDWYILKGSALITVADEFDIRLNQGEFFHIELGETHRLDNTTDDELVVLEIQRSESGLLLEDDIVRLQDDYNRISKKEKINASSKKNKPKGVQAGKKKTSKESSE